VPLIVRVDTHGKGRTIAETVTIEFSGSAAQTLEVPVSGTITKDVRLSSENLDLATSKTADVVVTRYDNKPLSISYASLPASLQVQTQTLSPFAQKLLVSINSDSPAGRHEEALAVHTNHPGLPNIVIPVAWTVPSSFSVSPQSVNFGVTNGGTLEASVQIKSAHQVKFVIKDCPKTMQLTVLPMDARNTNLKVVWNLKGGENVLNRSKIVLATDDPKEPVLSIPVYAAVNADVSCSVK